MPWRGLVCRGMCKPQSGDSPELAQGLPYKGKSMRNRGVSSPMPFLLIPRSLLRGGFIGLKKELCFSDHAWGIRPRNPIRATPVNLDAFSARGEAQPTQDVAGRD